MKTGDQNLTKNVDDTFITLLPSSPMKRMAEDSLHLKILIPRQRYLRLKAFDKMLYFQKQWSFDIVLDYLACNAPENGQLVMMSKWYDLELNIDCTV